MKSILKRIGAFALALMLLAPAFDMLCVRAVQTEPGDVDADGGITAADARLALRAALSIEVLSPEQTVSSDADRDGIITAQDARFILRCSLGMQSLEGVRNEDVSSVTLTAEERRPYESDEYDLKYLSHVTVGGNEHTILDNYYTFTVLTKDGTTEEDLLNMVGIIFNEDGEHFFVLPDPDKRAQGQFMFRTLHFSLLGAAELTDAQLLDLWTERAAAQSVTRRISEEEITPALSDMIIDGLKVNGMGKDQYAGAIVRGILSLDTRGEILTAAADGDYKTMQTKLANYAGEYLTGKLFKGEDDKILTQSLGDNADIVKKNMDDGDFATATLEIVKNIEKNMFSYVNYADKVASLTDKLADIWTDDMMNEQYETFKDLSRGGLTDEEWNLIYTKLRGAANRLSSKGIESADIRAKFEQRFENEKSINEKRKELMRFAAKWRSMGLMDSIYWGRDGTLLPSDTEKLNSLLMDREMLKAMLTLNGVFQRGEGYQTDEDFLNEALFMWIQCGSKARTNFYKWLREKGVYLPRNTGEPVTEEPYTGDDPFDPRLTLDDEEVADGV